MDVLEDILMEQSEVADWYYECESSPWGLHLYEVRQEDHTSGKAFYLPFCVNGYRILIDTAPSPIEYHITT